MHTVKGIGPNQTHLTTTGGVRITPFEQQDFIPLIQFVPPVGSLVGIQTGWARITDQTFGEERFAPKQIILFDFYCPLNVASHDDKACLMGSHGKLTAQIPLTTGGNDDLGWLEMNNLIAKAMVDLWSLTDMRSPHLDPLPGKDLPSLMLGISACPVMVQMPQDWLSSPAFFMAWRQHRDDATMTRLDGRISRATSGFGKELRR